MQSSAQFAPRTMAIDTAHHQRSTVSPRVLLDARKIGHGGIGVYIEQVVRGLLDTASVELSVVLPSRLSGYFGNAVGELIDDASPYSLDELFKFGRRLPWNRFDLFHEPHFTLPFWIPIPTVVTVHDLIQITHPERPWYPLVARPLIGSALRRASAIVAVSEATKQTLQRHFSFCRGEERVQVVPNVFEPPLPRVVDGPATPYLLAVFSNLKPHKGFADLLRAFARVFDRSLAPRPRLLLVGQGLRGEGLTQAAREIDALPEQVRALIEVRGEVSADELDELYRSAIALVVASRAEGFCIPALEALARGTPVVARPVPALREVTGGNAYLARDFSESSLADAIAHALVRRERVLRPRHLERYARSSVSTQLVSLYRGLCVEGGQ